MIFYRRQSGQRQKDGTIKWFSLQEGRLHLYGDRRTAEHDLNFWDTMKQNSMLKNGTPKGAPFEEFQRVVAVNVTDEAS